MKLPLLKDADVKRKRVLVRSDLDVPLTEPSTINHQQLTIEDDTRLKAGLPTVEYLLDHGAKVIVAGHLGRPQQGLRIKDEGLSLMPVAQWFHNKLVASSQQPEAIKVGDFDGWELDENLYVLENLRFYEEEEKNDPEFTKKLATLAEIYVNDAITVAHRNHASVVGIAKLLPHYCGLHLQKEIEVLGNVLENPKRLLAVIIGGAKIETKLPLIEKMRGLADYVLVGGKLPLEEEVRIMNQEARSNKDDRLVIADLIPDGTDITEESVRRFKAVISKAAMIVWNGPLGKIEVRSEKLEARDSERGTREVAQAIVQSSAYKIVGGGDTIDYLRRLGVLDKFDFVSMGGGAMLVFLSGEKLPGIEALLQ